ncbi:MAG: hypothetical protein KBT48_06265 [Firmicutes bacterium]|nr:hypothetical protein [Bacillota bacterium]
MREILIEIQAGTVMRNRFASFMGLDKYKYIMEHVYITDVSKDKEFQKVFSNFYGLSRSGKEWEEKFYNLFETYKNGNKNYAFLLKELSNRTGKLEASFASKICATLDPNMPILDRFVLQNLNLKLPYPESKNRIEKTISIYNEIQKWYEEYLETDNAKECIALFDKIFPDYKWVSDVKKIDFYLWSMR